MKPTFILAWRYIAHHRLKTLILVACLALTIVLPLCAHLLIAHYSADLLARASDTPLVIGAKGNRFDLALNALYFETAGVDPIPYAEIDRLRETGLARPIPLNLQYTARRYPIVGTSLAYFDYRNLHVIRGRQFVRIGEVVLGAKVAAELELQPGDTIFSDQRNVYDISRTYPLKMHIVGILAPTDSPDDRAVFTHVKTTWVIAGLAHGHQDVTTDPDPNLILQTRPNEIVTNASIFEYNEITPENIHTFHMHGDPADWPISALLAIPHDAKSETLLKARYNAYHERVILVPRDVIGELLGLVFRVKRIFDAGFVLVALTTALFLFLTLVLSQRLRQREMETMVKIGCGRWTILRLQAAELALVLLISLALSATLSAIVLASAPRITRLL